jgi:hypothetical protein
MLLNAYGPASRLIFQLEKIAYFFAAEIAEPENISYTPATHRSTVLS